MSSKVRGCAVGLVLGSILRAILHVLGWVLKLVGNIMVFFGLWAPFVYALFGGTLFLIFGFTPFDGSTNALMYLGGFLLCAVCALLITIRNMLVKPLGSIIDGFKNPIWSKETKDDNPKEAKPSFARRSFGKKEDEEPKKEIPKEYYSAIEKDTLIREYSDRFEVFRIENGKEIKDKIEFKN